MKLLIGLFSVFSLFSFKIMAQDDLKASQAKFLESQAALTKALEENAKSDDSAAVGSTETLTKEQQENLTKQMEDLKKNQDKAELLLKE